MRRTGTVVRCGAVLATLLTLGLAPAQAVPPVSACYDAFATKRWSDTLRDCIPWANKGDAEAQTLLGILYSDGSDGLGVDENLEKALELFQKAAEQGYAPAQYNIGNFYYNGAVVGQNYIKAFEWYLRAAKQGNVYAQYNVGMIYANGYIGMADFDKALEWHLKAAEQGFTLAQISIGSFYISGLGVKQDYKKAFDWFLKAAIQNDALAQSNIGSFYAYGLGVEVNYGESLKWYLKAAEQSYAAAQFAVGLIYDKGLSVKRDDNEALKWYFRAAEQDYAAATYNIGVHYKNGNGVVQDNDKAFEWLLKAAEQGFPDAQSSIGEYYANGKIVQQDYTKALEWYLKAAEQGYEGGQYNIGTLYANGQGVSVNYAKALEWFLKAAEQGSALAQTSIGGSYLNGHGVMQDYGEALKWFLKAALQNDEVAQVNIGYIYYMGLGGVKNYSKSFEFLKKASYREEIFSYVFLSILYIDGLGVSKNSDKSLDFYLHALKHSDGFVKFEESSEIKLLKTKFLKLRESQPSFLLPRLEALDPVRKVLTDSRLQLNVSLRLPEALPVSFQMRYTWTTPQGPQTLLQSVQTSTTLPQAPFPLTPVNFALELPSALPTQGALQARLEVLSGGVVTSSLDFQLDRQAPQPLERKGNLYVLAVGVNTFEDPSLPALSNAAQDPNTLLKVLTPTAKSLYQKVISYPLSQDEATLERVKAAMNEIKGVARPEDTVIAFFSTHGIYTQEKQSDGTLQDNYYVLLRDTIANNWAQSALSRETLLEFYRDTPGKMLLILETCRSALPNSEDRLLGGALQSTPRLALAGGGRGLDASGAAPLVFTGTTDGLLEAFTLPGQEKALLTASAGGKVALDRGKWGPRGALLEALVRVLSDPKRLSGQGTLDLNTLLVGVQTEVQSLTEGKQRPEFASALSWPLLAPGAP